MAREAAPAAPAAAAGAGALADDGLVQLCTFRVAGEDYAVDVMRVREIITPLPITPVPRAPPFVEGVIRLRGEVVPVLDLRRRFGLPPGTPGRKSRFVIVHVAGRRIGLVVDEVCEVVRVPRSDLRPAPRLVGQDGPRFFVGVCGGEGSAAVGGRRAQGAARLRLLVNVRALLEPATPGEAEAARALAEATLRA
jgi:purine-binding chemotaxis protein CheW